MRRRPTCAPWTGILLGVLVACSSRPDIGPDVEGVDAAERARGHFEEANAILHAWLIDYEAGSLEDLLEADDRIGAPEREAIIEEAARGEAWGRRAVSQAPGRVEGPLYQAANLALLALAKGRAQALFEGLPGRFRTACDRAIELDPDHANAAALRLKGKFLMTAPWPVGDPDEAGRALAEAVERAPVSENLLMLGDHAARAGDATRARGLWERATMRANAGDGSAQHEARIRELAARRLALLKVEGG
jgi:hypothetical protein